MAEEAPGASPADSGQLMRRECALRWRMEGALVAGPPECAEALLADPQEWRAEGTRQKLAPSVAVGSGADGAGAEAAGPHAAPLVVTGGGASVPQASHTGAGRVATGLYLSLY